VLRCSLVICIALLCVAIHSSPAAACSAGPEYDPRDYTQLLVLGRARSIELGARTPSGFVEATVTLDVVEVFRGNATSPLKFVDSASVSTETDPVTGQQVFAGGSGACGTIDDDPVGKYVLIALAKGDDSRWHANRLFGAMYTTRPDYVMYHWLLERHGVALSFAITGPLLEAGAFENALVP
jgi:hypothetical protein